LVGTYAKLCAYLVMADPASAVLGIITSITALLELLKNVTKFIREIREEDQQKRDLLKEIVATGQVLQELERKAKSPEWENTVRSMNRSDGPLDLLKSALETLKVKLRPGDTPLANFTNRILWYFEKGEYEEILSKIERGKATLSLILDL